MDLEVDLVETLPTLGEEVLEEVTLGVDLMLEEIKASLHPEV